MSGCVRVLTMVAVAALFLRGRDAALHFGVGWRLGRAVIQVAAGSRHLTQVSAGQRLAALKLQVTKKHHALNTYIGATSSG